jgi:hypothetical protein
MTHEQEIEEILIEAHAHGMRDEVMEWAKKEMEANHKLSRVDAYHQGYLEFCK